MQLCHYLLSINLYEFKARSITSKLEYDMWRGDRAISTYRLKFLVVRILSGLLTISCALFFAFAYFIIYRETLRHQERIKTQKLPQVGAERCTKEDKALKTTVFVVGAVIVYLLPLCLCLIVTASGLYEGLNGGTSTTLNTYFFYCITLNS